MGKKTRQNGNGEKLLDNLPTPQCKTHGKMCACTHDCIQLHVEKIGNRLYCFVIKKRVCGKLFDTCTAPIYRTWCPNSKALVGQHS